MPENRKYLPEEINYVLSRALAGWKPEAIAQDFKRDHAAYWGDKEFTRKQVSYIKNTYKIPPGAIRPYKEPGPRKSLTVSPMTRTLIMDPTSYESAPSKDEAPVASSSAYSRGDNKPEFVGLQAGFSVTMPAATGSTTTAPSFGITKADDGVDLNFPNAQGGDGLSLPSSTDFGTGGFATGPFAGLSDKDSSFFFNDAFMHGVGHHLLGCDDNNNASYAPAELGLEDQHALLDQVLLPVSTDNEQAAVQAATGGVGGGADLAETCGYPQEQQQQQQASQHQMPVASVFQGLPSAATGQQQQLHQHEQQQVIQEDTIMQSIEREPDAEEDHNKDDDGNQAQGIAGDAGDNDNASDYSPPFDFNTLPVRVPVTTNTAQHQFLLPPATQNHQQQQQQHQPAVLPSFAAGFGTTATTNVNNNNNNNSNNNTATTLSQPGNGNSSNRVDYDYFFGPHDNCRIENEHGHGHGHNGNDDGSGSDSLVVFRDQDAFKESFLAMQRREGGGYLLGLADGIEKGLEEGARLWARTDDPAGVAAAARARAQRSVASFGRAHRRVRAEQQQAQAQAQAAAADDDDNDDDDYDDDTNTTTTQSSRRRRLPLPPNTRYGYGTPADGNFSYRRANRGSGPPPPPLFSSTPHSGNGEGVSSPGSFQVPPPLREDGPDLYYYPRSASRRHHHHHFNTGAAAAQQQQHLFHSFPSPRASVLGAGRGPQPAALLGSTTYYHHHQHGRPASLVPPPAPPSPPFPTSPFSASFGGPPYYYPYHSPPPRFTRPSPPLPPPMSPFTASFYGLPTTTTTTTSGGFGPDGHDTISFGQGDTFIGGGGGGGGASGSVPPHNNAMVVAPAQEQREEGDSAALLGPTYYRPAQAISTSWQSLPQSRQQQEEEDEVHHQVSGGGVQQNEPHHHHHHHQQ